MESAAASAVGGASGGVAGGSGVPHPPPTAVGNLSRCSSPSRLATAAARSQLPGATPQQWFLAHGGRVSTDEVGRAAPASSAPASSSAVASSLATLRARGESRSLVGARFDCLWYAEREHERKWLDRQHEHDQITRALMGIATMDTEQMATAALHQMLHPAQATTQKRAQQRDQAMLEYAAAAAATGGATSTNESPPPPSTNDFYPPARSVHSGLGLTAKGGAILSAQVPHLADMVVAAEDSMDRYGDGDVDIFAEQSIAAATAAAQQGQPVGLIARRRIEGAPAFRPPAPPLRRSLWTDESAITKVVDPVPRLSGFRVSKDALEQSARGGGANSHRVVEEAAPERLIFDIHGSRSARPSTGSVPDEPFADEAHWPAQKYPPRAPTLHAVLAQQPVGENLQPRPMQPHIPISFRDRVATPRPIPLRSSLSIWPSVEEALQPVPFNIHVEQTHAGTTRPNTAHVGDLVHIRSWRPHTALHSTQLSHFIPRQAPADTPGLRAKYSYFESQAQSGFATPTDFHGRSERGAQTARPTSSYDSNGHRTAPASRTTSRPASSRPSVRRTKAAARPPKNGPTVDSIRAMLIATPILEPATLPTLDLPGGDVPTIHVLPVEPVSEEKEQDPRLASGEGADPPDEPESPDGISSNSSSSSSSGQSTPRSPTPPLATPTAESILAATKHVPFGAFLAASLASSRTLEAPVSPSVASWSGTPTLSPIAAAMGVTQDLDLDRPHKHRRGRSFANQPATAPPLQHRRKPSIAKPPITLRASPRGGKHVRAPSRSRSLSNHGLASATAKAPSPSSAHLPSPPATPRVASMISSSGGGRHSRSSSLSRPARHQRTGSRWKPEFSDHGLSDPSPTRGDVLVSATENSDAQDGDAVASSDDVSPAHRHHRRGMSIQQPQMGDWANSTLFAPALNFRHERSRSIASSAAAGVESDAPQPRRRPRRKRSGGSTAVVLGAFEEAELKRHEPTTRWQLIDALYETSRHEEVATEVLGLTRVTTAEEALKASDTVALHKAASPGALALAPDSEPSDREDDVELTRAERLERWQRRLTRTEAKHAIARAAAIHAEREAAEEAAFESDMDADDSENPSDVAERRRQRAARLARHASLTMDERSVAEALDIDSASRELEERLGLFTVANAPSTDAPHSLIEFSIAQLRKEEETKQRALEREKDDSPLALYTRRKAVPAASDGGASNETDELRPQLFLHQRASSTSGHRRGASKSGSGHHRGTSFSRPDASPRDPLSRGRSAGGAFTFDSLPESTPSSARATSSSRTRRQETRAQAKRPASHLQAGSAGFARTTSPATTTRAPFGSAGGYRAARPSPPPPSKIPRQPPPSSAPAFRAASPDCAPWMEEDPSALDDVRSFVPSRPVVPALDWSKGGGRPASAFDSSFIAAPLAEDSAEEWIPRPTYRSTLHNATGFSTSRPSTAPHLALSTLELSPDATPWQRARFEREARRQAARAKRQQDNAARVQATEDERAATTEREMEAVARALSDGKHTTRLLAAAAAHLSVTNPTPPPLFFAGLSPSTRRSVPLSGGVDSVASDVIARSGLVDKGAHQPLNRSKVRRHTTARWPHREQQVHEMAAKMAHTPLEQEEEAKMA